MAKRLLAVAWEMPPLSGPRAVQVTRTLVALGEMGWGSRVVCFGARSARYQQDYHLAVEEISGHTVTRLPVESPEEWLLFRALWRVLPPLKHLPDEKIVWVPSAIAEMRRALAAEPADVLVSFAQPWSNHIAALTLRHDTGLPWVAHFSDPWVDSPYAVGPAWVRARAAAMERAVVQHASRVVFVNQYTLDRGVNKYPAAWLPHASVVPQGHDGRTASRRAQGGPLRIAYTGRFYTGIRTPDVVLSALADLDRTSSLAGRLEVEFVGSGMEQYQQRSRDRGLDGIVSFRGRVSPDRSRALAAAADVLMVIDAPSARPGLFLPSKLIDYLPLEKPVLAIAPLEGPTADLVRELEYRVVDPVDQAGIAAAIGQQLAAYERGTLAASSAHQSVAARYSIASTTRQFADVLAAAVTDP
jgi:glycosyltransferase involved in cell wall biosynthesis